MTTYRTGNAIGSADPRDLYDNSENLDEFVNSKEKTTHPDRLGVPRKTWHGMEQDFQSFLQSSGYQDIGDYAAGIEITARNQVVRADGELWRISAAVDLPYTTTGDWAADSGDFVATGDAVLRQELADPAQGGNLVKVTTSSGEQSLVDALNNRIIYVNNIAELQAISPNLTSDYQHVYVKEYYDGTGYGGGLYVNAGSGYSGSDAIEGADGSQWRMVVDNNVFPIDRLGAVKGDPRSVRDAFILAIECVREKGSGTVLVAPGEWEMEGVLYEVNTSNITFHFEKGCHIKMGYLLLGWYPIEAGVGHKNVSFTGGGVIESLPGMMWHNDLVFVDGVSLTNLTFIRPITSGHYLDLMGCKNVYVDNITVLGSNIEREVDPRLFSEFIQVSLANAAGMGWPAKREEYGALVNGEPSEGVKLSNSKFLPYTDSSGTTYPPRPIGDHNSWSSIRDIRICDNIFVDVIRQDISERYSWLEIPTADGVWICGNTFIQTDAQAHSAASYIIDLRGTTGAGVFVKGNTFKLGRPGEHAYNGGIRVISANKVTVEGNLIEVLSTFNDFIIASSDVSTSISLIIKGNQFYSAGRRLLYREAEFTPIDSLLVEGNHIEMYTENASDHRHALEGGYSRVVFVGNSVIHPGDRGIFFRQGVTSMSGNTFGGGGNFLVNISSGILTGNVFNTTGAPDVTIGGASQTSQGWNFIHVPG